MEDPSVVSRDAGFLHPLVGDCLSAVTFVSDYVQLDFIGIILTTFTLPIVEASGSTLIAEGKGWRDGLCKRIGVPVRSAWVQPQELGIEFEDGSRFSVSLKDSDYRGPEAITSSDRGRPLVVL